MSEISPSEFSRLVSNSDFVQKPAGKWRFRKMWFAAVASLLFAVSMGMGGAFSATATDNMKRPDSRVQPTEDDVTWIGSLLAFGAIFGGAAAGYVTERIGRKGALMSLSFPFVTGWLFIAYASSVAYIFIGRFITGVCVGALCTITPPYLVEISTPDVRGMLGSFFQLSACIGVLIANSLALCINWSWQAIASSVAVVVALILIAFMPESPRWLVAKGRYQEAVDAVRFLQGPGFDAASECVSIYEDISSQPKGKISWKEMLKPEAYKPALLGIGILMFQQLCGANAILFYTVQVFKESSSPISPYHSTVLLDAIMVVTTAMAGFLIDKTGRKLLLILSGAGMAVTLFIVASFDYAKSMNSVLGNQYSWIPLTAMIIYIVLFSLGYGPIPWLMIAEMSPNRTRGLIGAVASVFCWVFIFVVTKSFDFLNVHLKNFGTYFLYGAFSIISCVFTIYCLPETKGKRIEDIQLSSPKANGDSVVNRRSNGNYQLNRRTNVQSA